MGKDPQHFSVFAVDIQRYSARNDQGQVELRQQLRQLQRVAAKEAGLRLVEWNRQDTGDGVLALIPARISKARLAADLVHELRIALEEANRPRRDAERIRLRVALHHGDVYPEPTGFPGAAVVDTCRLLDSKPLRAALDEVPGADVSVILSDRMFQDVDGKRGIHQREFRAVQVAVKDFMASAWITVPGFSPPDLSAQTSPHDSAATDAEDASDAEPPSDGTPPSDRRRPSATVQADSSAV
jgi:hypothetical protein